jgi:alanine-glyoxylate transaminase/serine-glyoxylate transaminase/serine-pyruvate transaminase
MLQEEGLENSWARHQKYHLALRAGIEAMGLGFYVTEKDRLPQLNAVTVPAGVDEAEVRARLLQDYSLEIGAGLGALAGKIWRIGLMGHGANMKNVLYCLGALEAVLAGLRVPIQPGVAASSASRAIA